eukprot:502655_1
MPILIDFNDNNYISAPLPITMCSSDGNDPNAPRRIFSAQKHIAHMTNSKNERDIIKDVNNISKNNILNKKSEFISPSFILEEWTGKYTINNVSLYICSGNFNTLSLNLEAIVHSWGSERQIPLLHFLLHRKISDSKNIII